MNFDQQLLYLDKTYTIISAEQEFIIHPAAIGILPITEETAGCTFGCKLQINNYCLLLKNLTLLNGGDANSEIEQNDVTTLSYDFEKPINYNGTILIGSTPIKEYVLKGYGTMSFSYKCVNELIFEEGNLITTIDHSKAMLRIRKNIELGYRSLTNRRDVRCITHFMKSTFIGDYKPFSGVKKRVRYLKHMKKREQNNSF